MSIYTEEAERRSKRNQFYVSTYCNFAHRIRDGRPIGHQCRTIPPAALRAEMDGRFEDAIAIMQGKPPKPHIVAECKSLPPIIAECWTCHGYPFRNVLSPEVLASCRAAGHDVRERKGE